MPVNIIFLMEQPFHGNVHRKRRRKCEVAAPDFACTHCLNRGIACSIGLMKSTPSMSPELFTTSPSYQSMVPDDQEPMMELPPLEVCEELTDLYFRYIHDAFHSLFHPPTLKEAVVRGTVPRVILFAVMSLAARSKTKSDTQSCV